MLPLVYGGHQHSFRSAVATAIDGRTVVRVDRPAGVQLALTRWVRAPCWPERLALVRRILLDVLAHNGTASVRTGDRPRVGCADPGSDGAASG